MNDNAVKEIILRSTVEALYINYIDNLYGKILNNFSISDLIQRSYPEKFNELVDEYAKNVLHYEKNKFTNHFLKDLSIVE